MVKAAQSFVTGNGMLGFSKRNRGLQARAPPLVLRKFSPSVHGEPQVHATGWISVHTRDTLPITFFSI